PLVAERMAEAAQYLVGEHDFTSFCSVATQVESKVRTIYSLDVIREGKLITLRVEGSGFLYNMVRIIAGTLIKVGQGAMEPEQIREILEAMDRQKAGPTAPPEGLTLVEIRQECND
ncbi:MAG: tRNA pseudouridine(38-40) synthase TruA, partial [Lachnospiraceae bacterium]|nr:tRNA pseudouridine(38-40) synthase TruA [Lachnospiraceae bacterium]